MTYAQRNSGQDHQQQYANNHPHSALVPQYEQPQYEEQPQRPQMTKAQRSAVQLKIITNAATQIELASTKDEIPTLYFEQAPIKKVGQQKQGDWDRKIIFQISPLTELYQLIDFLINKNQNQEIAFKYHGKNNNKTLRIKKNSDGSMMIGIGEASNHYSGVIHPTAIVQFITLAYKAYADRFNISIGEAMAIINKSPKCEIPKE
jgi:hypothetical protein